MQSLEENRKGISINVAVLTVSDSRTIENDKSGKYLIKSVEEEGHKCIERNIIIDDVNKIIKVLRKWIDDKGIDVIIITGGTGITGRDVTPEATLAVGDKELPGFGEQMRQVSLNFVPTAILSRQTAVIRNSTLIINLPGQPKAIRETLEGLRDSSGRNVVKGIFAAVPYGIELIGGPLLMLNDEICKAYRPKKK